MGIKKQVGEKMKNFFLLVQCLYRFFVTLLQKIYRCMNGGLLGAEMLHGEIIVTGSDKIEIELGEHHPKQVFVKFKDDHMHPPCNPKHHDHLRWEIKNKHFNHKHDHRNDHCNHHNRFVLEIHWHVSNVRVIDWVVYY